MWGWQTAVSPSDWIDWEQEQATPLKFSHSLRGLLRSTGQLGPEAEAVLSAAPVTYTETLAQLMLHLKLFSVG
jgi:hypothetical protein